jgi:hypothetical protein
MKFSLARLIADEATRLLRSGKYQTWEGALAAARRALDPCGCGMADQGAKESTK